MPVATGESRKRKSAEDGKPLAKKTKPELDDGFVEGAIKRIRMQNFLTYTKCTYEFGPALNVLLGANGTGKSSVVCGICLGLAGAPQLLGRAREVGEFVRHGCTDAEIEIEVCRVGRRNSIIRRCISRQTNSSRWFVDGRSATKNEVQNLVQELNIQLSNLCQFLPQDRVVEFAKMSPPDLLKATEQAIGNPEMFANHERLIKLRREEKEMQERVGREEDELEKLRHLNSLLERDVQRFQERQDYLRKIDHLEKKRPWVEYEEIRQKYQQSKEKRERSRSRWIHLTRENEPKKKELEDVGKEQMELEKQRANLDQLIIGNDQKVRRKHDHLETLTDQLADPVQELEAARKDEADRLKRLRDLDNQISKYEDELAALPDDQNLQPEIEDVKQKMRGIHQQIMAIQSRQQDCREAMPTRQREIERLEGEIRRLEDMRNQRLEALRRQHKDTYTAVKWLRENRDKFRQQVFEPILLSVNMRDPAYAKYFENLVGFNVLIMFVFQNRDDMETFCTEVRDRQNLRINTMVAPQVSIDHLRARSSVTKDVLKRFHFSAVMLDLIEGPEPVLRVLCSKQKVHEVPIGTDWTEENASQVVEESRLSRFYTPCSSYNVRISKYGQRAKSTTIVSVPDARFLSMAVDTSQRKHLQDKLMEAKTDLENRRRMDKELVSEERQLRADGEKLKDEKKRLTDRKDCRRRLLTQIESCRRRRQQSEAAKHCLADVEERTKRQQTQINNRRSQAALEIKSLCEQSMSRARDRMFAGLKLIEVGIKKEKLEATHQESQQELDQAEQEMMELDRRCRLLKADAKAKRDVAVRAIGSEGDRPNENWLKLFNLYPSTLSEIDDQIHEIKAIAELTCHTNPQVVREYKQRQKDIERLESTLENGGSSLDSKRKEIETIKERWLGPLKELIEKINTKFSASFQQLNCVGEVSLDQDEDFDKYAIAIKAKFRAGQQLHQLTAHHQSGGERSVTTMLFLMALQNLTRCPFRVVDEINQGMDPNNERKVFEFVVADSCRRGTSQYFLVTPKLLTDLKYNANMKVHTIYSGTSVPGSSAYNMVRIIRSALNAQHD